MDIDSTRSAFPVSKVSVGNCSLCSNNCSWLVINVSHLKEERGEIDVDCRKCGLFGNAQSAIKTIFSNRLGIPVRERVVRPSKGKIIEILMGIMI